MDLYILKYNNYYNRIVKREVDLSSYLTKGTLIHTQYNVNYAPGDGVNIRQVLNNENYGDYAIYADGNTIVSRWFIIEANRNCKGQFGLTLRRDLVVDNFDTVLNADCFIEKAILPDNDPMIFNKENMTVNQIKSEVAIIKDATYVSYIVGYVDKGFSQEKQVVPKSALATVNTLAGFKSDWGSSDSIYDKATINPTWQINTKGFVTGLSNYYTQNVKFDKNNNISVATSPDYDTNILIEYSKYDTLKSAIGSADKTVLINALSQDSPQAIKNITDLLSYNGKLVLDTENSTYYKISITSTTDKFTYNVPASGTSYNALKEITKSVTTKDPNDKAFVIEVQGTKYTYTKTVVSVDSYEYAIDVNHQTLNDQIYDMFVIPYYTQGYINIPQVKVGNELAIRLANDGAIAGLAVANDLIKKNSTNGKLKDIQILPYFPMPSIVDDYGSGSLIKSGRINLPDDTYIDWVKDSKGNKITCIIWCNQNQFNMTREIDKPFKINPDGSTPKPWYYTDNVKLSNECDMIRLVAPNHQSMFEFSPARNGIKANELIVDIECTYKPYQPSIHIKPQFDRLYGPNDLYKDERGLLFSGDFSMTQGTDAWIQYKRQNVNYLNIFDRQIQNMEITNKIQNTQSLITGALGALGTGLGVGAISGNAGLGIVAGGLSGLAGVADYGMQKALQSEALDYKQDMFNYQLGNIKALPDTISKIDAFNNVFALWPIVEYYTCTEEEKQAVANKIAYNSMSVGRIGKIKDFKDNKWSYGDIASKGYIKGSLIRVEIDEDTHYINELANEIYKGVYF